MDKIAQPQFLNYKCAEASFTFNLRYLVKTKIIALFAVVALAVSATANAQQINEMRISSPGATDDVSNFFELFDAPGTSLDGLTFLAISSEFNPGLVNNAISLDGFSIGADGFFLASADSDFYGDETDLATGVDFFGSPASFLLVDGFSAAEGDDLDADDDGVLDDTFFSSILDDVSVADGDDTADVFYGNGAILAATTSGFPPAQFFRDPDGGPWDFLDDSFDNTSRDTAGFSNALVVPEPGSAMLFGLGCLLVGVRRKRRA